MFRKLLEMLSFSIKRTKITRIFTKRFFAIIIGYAFSITVFWQSYSLYSMYMQFLDGVNEWENGNYANSQSVFSSQNSILPIEEWKKEFNIGVSYYANNMQAEARESYSKAREIAAKNEDISTLCAIDINISYSYEKTIGDELEVLNRQHYTDSDDDKNLQSTRIRNIMKIIVQAVLSREKVSSSCEMLKASSFKTNIANIETDKNLYQKLNERAFALDGKKESEIVEKESNFTPLANLELSNQVDENSQNRTKIEKLIEQQIESQIEFEQNSQLQRSKVSRSQTPW